MKDKLVRILKNGGVFVLLMGITVYIILKGIDFNELAGALKNANLIYLFIAMLLMCSFVVCEGENIGRGLVTLGYKPTFFQKIKYAAAGFFFSSITPSATGGQPMQLYYMHADGIDISHGALALLNELASYQIVTVSFAVVGLFFEYKNIGAILPLVVIGVTLNVAFLFFILAAMFTKKLSSSLVNFAYKVLKFFKYKKSDAFLEGAQKHLDEYRRGAQCIRQNKLSMVKMLLTTCVQFIAMHSIPYLVYRCMGLSGYSYFTAFFLQAILYVSVSILPLPGAVGASEGGFMSLFRILFPEQLIGAAVLLSRGVSFYLYVLVTGLFLGIYSLRKKNAKKDGSL